VLDDIGALPPEISVVLPVSPEDAFALLTEPERLRRWKTVSARVDLRAGGAYRWTIVPGHAVRGTYIEVEKGRRLVFGWGWEDSADLGPDASTVTVTFEPTDGGTLVRLVHTGLNAEQAASHLVGWRHFFGRLEVAAVAGDAGPDEWAAAPDPMTDLACAEAALAACQRALRSADVGSELSATADGVPLTKVADHLAAALTRLAIAADSAPADPGAGVGAEQRVAAIGQQALEAWAGRDRSGAVAYGDTLAPAGLVLAWTAIDLMVHAVEVAAVVGERPSVSEPLAAYLLDKADELAAPRPPDGRSLADALLTGPDEDLLRRLETAVAQSRTALAPGDTTGETPNN
jgi:uncharacterized protein YndB with AHSA1/START domain